MIYIYKGLFHKNTTIMSDSLNSAASLVIIIQKVFPLTEKTVNKGKKKCIFAGL